MAIRTWISATQANWTAATGTPWSGTVAPVAGDDVVFDGAAGKAVFLQTSLTLQSLSMTNAASVLDIGTTLTANRALSTTGGITISAGTINIVTNTADTSIRSLNAGTTLSMSGGTITMNSANHTVSAGSGIAFSGGGTISGKGTVSGDISGSGGTISANVSGGTLNVTKNIAGSNGFSIGDGATMALTTATSVGTSTFSFGGSTGTLAFGAAGALSLSNVGVTGMQKGAGANTQTTAIDFDQDVVSAKFDNTTDVLTVTLSSGTVTFQLNDLSGAFANWNAGADSVFITDTVCYAAGTRIETDRGAVAIEDLRPGDMVITVDGAVRSAMPVKWVGVRQVTLANHPSLEQVAPVRIARHAFAANVPSRDLVVSPPHAIHVDGKLIPAKLLVNDMTITRAYDLAEVTYFHVELDRHAVILAESLPAESYLDTGNRSFFRNSAVTTIGAATYHVDDASQIWEEKACAPLAVAARDVRPHWDMLVSRAHDMGFQAPVRQTTTDADLHVVVDGRRIEPTEVIGRTHRFILPRSAGDVRLASRSTAPSRIDGWRNDQRALGIAIRGITAVNSQGSVNVPADHPALTTGWHAVERQGAAMWRWTNGDAVLPVQTGGEATMLEIQVADTATYLVTEVSALAAAA